VLKRAESQATSRDASEKLVADFLAYRGLTDIAYEPDGKATPDFLVDRRIAVEVRRLNQNYDTGKSTEGLEEVAIPLWHGLKKLASSLGPSRAGESWFLNNATFFLALQRRRSPTPVRMSEADSPLQRVNSMVNHICEPISSN
jgi:hypothetical protein